MGQSQSSNTGRGDGQTEDGNDNRADYYKLLDLERDASEEEQVFFFFVDCCFHCWLTCSQYQKSLSKEGFGATS